jgi:hypothetical protein
MAFSIGEGTICDHTCGECMSQESKPPSRPFLLMEGGPLYRIERRIGLGKKRARVTTRIAALLPLITYLPLLLLSAIQGTAIGDAVHMPFLHDFSAYTRFLLAVPLLLFAETIMSPLIAEAAEHFITSGVVGEKDYAAFDRAVEQGLRSRDSAVAEIVILVLAYLSAYVAFRETAVHVSTWFDIRTGANSSLTLAGWWLVLFCLPIFHFLVLRWLWRIFLWFQFLNRISRLDLHLYPTHPDRAGGLGFVGETQRIFSIFLFSYSIGAAGVFANDILYDKIPLKTFVPAIACYVVIALILLLVPLVVFTGRLLETKRHGLQQYGTLATDYSGSFHRKWIGDGPPDREALLGTADIQSLADLGNVYTFVEKMNAVPISPRTPIQLALASLLPLTPLLFTVMPAKDVARLLLKFIM